MVGEKVPCSNGRQLAMVEPTQQQEVDDEQYETEMAQYGKNLFAADKALQTLDEADPCSKKRRPWLGTPSRVKWMSRRQPGRPCRKQTRGIVL